MKKILIAVAILLLIGVVVWFMRQQEPISISLARAELGEVKATISNTRAGTIKACRRSKLSMPIGGLVARLLVDEGDEVEAGDVLLELWNEDQRARVYQASTRIDAARLGAAQACVIADGDRREANRLGNLVKRNLASEEAADNAESRAQASELACEGARAQHKEAEAALALQQAMLELTVLKAPFAGVVAEINGEVGEYVTPSPPGVPTPPAVDLIDTSCLYVTAPIDEVDAASVRVGLPAEINLDAFGNRVFPGRVSRIAPYVLDLEKQARTVEIDVRFDAKPEDITLLVGYSADVSVVLEAREDVVRIPSETLFDGNQVLYLNPDSNRLEQRTLVTGVSNWSFTEVKEGLKAGDAVVVSLDDPGVEPGATVRVSP